MNLGIGSVIKQSLPDEFDGQEGVEDPNEVDSQIQYRGWYRKGIVN